MASVDPLGHVDRGHVSLSTEVSCLYWEAKLGAARNDIRCAMDAVGVVPDDVARWLSAEHRSHIRPEPRVAT